MLESIAAINLFLNHFCNFLVSCMVQFLTLFVIFLIVWEATRFVDPDTVYHIRSFAVLN